MLILKVLFHEKKVKYQVQHCPIRIWRPDGGNPKPKLILPHSIHVQSVVRHVQDLRHIQDVPTN